MVGHKRGEPRKKLLIVEGGGDRNTELSIACRKAFSALQLSAGVQQQARVVAAGGRKAAYDKFVTEFSNAGEQDRIVLLVDAEEVVTTGARWQHVKDRQGDGWAKPDGADERHLYFMAVTMETWLLAEPSGLAKVFGGAFKPGTIPKWPNIEQVPKTRINTTIGKATGGYDKGQHSFSALAGVSALALEASCPSAKALFDHLRS